VRALAGVTPLTPTFAAETQTDSSHSKLTAVLSLCCFTDSSPFHQNSIWDTHYNIYSY